MIESKIKIKNSLILTALAFLAFLLFTLSLTFVDRGVAGDSSTEIGWKTLNAAVFGVFGYNKLLFDISDWCAVMAFVIAFAYFFIGIAQWIKRKNIWKTDFEIIALGVFYVVVLAVYVLFEFVVVNCRPILTGGTLPAPSYPSSTSLALICLTSTSIMQTKRLLPQKIHFVISLFLIVYTTLTVAGRLISGAHWLTDILGGVLLSAALVSAYKTALVFYYEKNKKV